MICSIRNFNEFGFSGDLSPIKELIFDYNDYLDIEKFLNLTKDKDKTFVFNISRTELNEDRIKVIKDLCSIRDNIKFTGREFIKDIPFFYLRGCANANSLEVLDALCKRGVTDVYITGQAGFSMGAARQIANKYGVLLRAVPNSALSIYESHSIDCLTSFWIRPEDLELYNSYIDVIEFAGADEKQCVFYDIYFQSRSWNGNLRTIIVGLEDLPNLLPQHFTLARLNCDKKCLTDKCHSCFKFAQLSNVMKDNKLELETLESE